MKVARTGCRSRTAETDDRAGLRLRRVRRRLSTSIRRVRAQFPIWSSPTRPLVYLDNAATTQKPRVVIDRDAATRSTSESNANVHRGLHRLSERATQRLRERPGARGTLRRGPYRRPAGDHRRDDRGAQPGGHSWSPSRRLGAGRRDPRHRDGAPLQHRALAAGGRGSTGATGRTRCPSGRRRRRSSMARAATACWASRTRIVAVAAISNVLGTRQSDRRDHRAGESPLARQVTLDRRVRRPARTRTDRRAFAGTVDFVRADLGPQGLRPERYRCRCTGRRELLNDMRTVSAAVVR